MVTRFGAYEILHELKAGGMGAVLLGRRRGPGAFEQLVAIKTIRAEFAGAEAVRAMFLDEAAILARISHPGIATVHDFGEEGGILYMVMEYVAGNSFRGLLDQAPPPAVAARAIAEACRGLHAAHEVRDNHGALMGVVHRDISPDNLMLGFDGHVKVIDFGIALVKNRQAPVTEFGTVKGKPPYMSPEQVKNEALDRRSDVFSIGVVLHELLTGKPLFDGDSIYAVARAVEHQQILPPSQVRGESLPLGLDAAVMNALERDPARRTATAAALAEALEAVITSAADETLEAWADRALVAPREAHRVWLAGVVSGRDGVPSIVGRATGAVTAHSPSRSEPADVAAAPADRPSRKRVPPDPDPGGDTDAGTDADADAPAPHRLSLLLGVALLLTAGVIVAVLSLRGTTTTATPDAAIDAAVVVVDAGVVADAAVVDAVTDAATDAAPDAPRRKPVPIDAGRRPPIDAARPPRRDAAVAAVVIDARPVPTGAGVVNIRARSGSGYVNVTVDGRALGPTPILKRRLAAGAHTVEMRDPVSGDVVYQASFELADGAIANITQR